MFFTGAPAEERASKFSAIHGAAAAPDSHQRAQPGAGLGIKLNRRLSAQCGGHRRDRAKDDSVQTLAEALPAER